MEPQVVERIVSPKGKTITRLEPKEYREVMKPQTAADLTDMMTRVVASGTATSAQISGVEIAGKTGTAETGQAGANNTWFIAFAPADDPQVAIAVAL